MINDVLSGQPLDLRTSVIISSATDMIKRAPAPRQAAADEGLTRKAKLFRGLADRSRLAILEALRGGSRTVSEIVEITGLSQPNVSNHLACLLDCGLVQREPKGRYVVYRLCNSYIERLLAMAEELLLSVATGVDACRRYGEPTKQ